MHERYKVEADLLVFKFILSVLCAFVTTFVCAPLHLCVSRIFLCVGWQHCTSSLESHTVTAVAIFNTEIQFLYLSLYPSAPHSTLTLTLETWTVMYQCCSYGNGSSAIYFARAFVLFACGRQGDLTCDDKSPINLPSPSYYSGLSDASFKGQ